MSQIPLRMLGNDPAEGAASKDRRWIAQDDYRMLSMAFSVSSVDARFAEALRWHLAPFRLDRAPPGGFPVELLNDASEGEQPEWIFRIGTVERFRCTALTEAVHRAVWEIHAEVHERVRDCLLLHAGAVAREGRALLLSGRTGSGKSSLTLGLLQAGFSYLSDELGALDPVTQRAYPFPKLIKLDPDALHLFPGLQDRLEDRRTVPFRLWERFVRLEDVGATTAGPTDVRWLVFPTADFDDAPRLTPMTKAASVEAMAAHCLNLFRYGERGVILLSRVAREAQAFQLVGGSLRDRVALLSDRLA